MHNFASKNARWSPLQAPIESQFFFLKFLFKIACRRPPLPLPQMKQKNSQVKFLKLHPSIAQEYIAMHSIAALGGARNLHATW